MTAAARLRRGGFSPLALSPFAWYRADRYLLNDGDPLGLWQDSAGSRDASQPTVSKRPTNRNAVLAGRPVERFDGVDDFASVGAVAFGSISNPATIVAVAKRTAGTGTTHITDSFTSSTGGQRLIFGIYGTGTGKWWASAGTAPFIEVTATGGFDIVVMQHNGASSKIRCNGGTGVAGSTDAVTCQSLAIGAGSVATANFFSGDLAELLLFNRLLTVGEINQLGAYLAAKYGLTWTTAT